jgi:uncharacterized protein YggE
MPEPTQPVVSVRGEVLREVPAEIAIISVAISGRDRDKATATDHVVRRQSALLAALGSFPEAVERVDSTGLSAYASYESKRRERVDMWIANLATTVTLGGLDAAPTVLAALADVESATISGPRWALRPNSPVHRDARIGAVSAALQRAADYAAAVGSTVTGLLEISDSNLMSGGGMPLMAGMARNASASVGLEDLDLTPQDQQVHASVEVRVTISPPTIGLDGGGEPAA